jgi:hypothetical protein
MFISRHLALPVLSVLITGFRVDSASTGTTPCEDGYGPSVPISLLNDNYILKDACV